MIRPIRPEDEPLIAKFHETLSERTVYLRYLHMMNLNQRIAHSRLSRICFNDYDREIALVAESGNGQERTVLGVARLTKVHGTNEGRFAMIITDAYQGKGLGSELLTRLIGIARDEKIGRLVAFVSPDNTGMLRLLRRLGFQVPAEPDENNLLFATLDL